ncbi:histone H2B.3-like [Miscanthus floridulus]|uniref:histone H2B.3-like n=1 Tax=Miscanthus floridulus TaxID=154761 RepID=UPI00345B0AFC
MAPKRRGNKVVGSVVRTKVVQETVEVIVADDDDGAEAEQQLVPEALALSSPAVDVSGSTVVHVEVTTPDGGDNATGSDVKQPTAAKRGRGRREEDKQPSPPEDSIPVPQSQQTQDPNEEQEEDDASKKKQQDDEEEQQQQPETPRVASERKATPKKSKPKPKPKTKPQQHPGGGGDAGKKRPKARRRLGQASSGGDAGMGGIGGYKRYVWRVLKQVHPDLGVSGHAMQVLDMMMADMFDRLADEAARLSKATGRVTLTSREVQSAVRLVLPGDLGKHAISEGTKAISKYMSYA